MQQIISLDVGSVRIGAAISDPSGTFAHGLCVLDASSDWIAELADLVSANDAKKILVGMPRRTDGTEGPEARAMRGVIERIARAIPDIELIEWDERFTTRIATQVLLEGDVSRKNRRRSVDKIAATILLQSYLDSLRADDVEPAYLDIPTSGRRDCRAKNNKRAPYR